MGGMVNGDNGDNATLEASFCAFGLVGNTCGMCTQELARCCGACGEDGTFAEQESSCNYRCNWNSEKFKQADYCASCDFATCWITNTLKSAENGFKGIFREIVCLVDGRLSSFFRNPWIGSRSLVGS